MKTKNSGRSFWRIWNAALLFIKARGMYSEEEKDMIFLVVDRKEVHAVQRKVQEIDPKAFFVVTDAYDTYGEGFKPFPEAGAIQAQ